MLCQLIGYKYTCRTQQPRCQAGVSSHRKRKLPGAVSYEALGISPSAAGDYVVFLEMYLDESYGQHSPNIVVGGFASPIDLWAEFASAWKTEVLGRFNIPFLPMKDLWNPNASLYKHLSESARDELFEVSKALITEYVDIGVGCVIDRDDFLLASSHEHRSKFGTDYNLGVMVCLNAIRQQLGANAQQIKVSVFLEDGHRNTRQAGLMLSCNKAQV